MKSKKYPKKQKNREINNTNFLIIIKNNKKKVPTSQPEESMDWLISKEEKVLVMSRGQSLLNEKADSILNMYDHRDVLMKFEIDLSESLNNNASRLYRQFLTAVKH